MNSTFGQCSLYLHPVQHTYTIENISLFIKSLQDIDFISKKIENQAIDNHYFTGTRFLDYIAYMGCSPTIQFEPNENNKNFCHIKIHLHDSEKLLVSNKQTRAPHCPNCTKPVSNWSKNKTDLTIYCEHCNTDSKIEEFNWRKMAGYSRLFIEITDIFPKEAIPQQILLENLKQQTDIDWLYFYCCQ